MDIDPITVTVDSRTFSRMENGLSAVYSGLEQNLDKAFPAVRKELLNMLNNVYRQLERMHAQQWKPGYSGANLYRRSGRGLKAMKKTIAVTGTSLRDLTGTIEAVDYMVIQETGATVTAKRSGFLTIPLPAVLDSRGIPKRSSARDWKNTFVQRSKKGNLLIFRRRGKTITPLYVLKKRVKIPPRLKLQQTFDQQLPYFEQKAFEILSARINELRYVGG